MASGGGARAQHGAGDVHRLLDVRRRRQAVGTAAAAAAGRARLRACNSGAARCWSRRASPDRDGNDCSGTTSAPGPSTVVKCWQAPAWASCRNADSWRVGLLPVVHDDDLAPVGELEAGDVDRVAERMFGKLRAGHIVDAAAAIGAEHVEPDDRLRRNAPGRRAARPASSQSSSAGDHRAIDRHRPCRPAPRRRRAPETLKRMRHAADAGSVDLAASA